MKPRIVGPLIAASALMTMLPATEAHAKKYWVPSQIVNGAPGRAVLTSDPKGVVGTLLKSLGQFWSHSGMFIDNGFVIRHNTANPDKLKVVDSSGRGCSSGCVPHRLNWSTLSSAEPGIISQTVAEAYGSEKKPEFNFFDLENNGTMTNRNAAVLSRQNTAGIGGSLAYDFAANKMVDYEGFYSFYSYTDIWQTEPELDPGDLHLPRDLARKNMCSGTIAWALFTGGGLGVFPVFYPASVRNPAAPVLHRSIRDMVGKKTPNTLSTAFIGSMLLGPGGGLTLAFFVASISDATKNRIANQVVNCMAFNDCSNTGTRWQNGVGDGWSLSPDNLLPMGVLNPLGQAWGMSGWDPNNSYTKWYDSVEDILYSGGFWQDY